MLYDCTKVHRKYYMYLDVWTRGSEEKGVWNEIEGEGCGRHIMG